LSGLDDAGFDPPSEIHDDALGRVVVGDGCQRLTRLQDLTRSLRQGGLIDLGGTVLKVVGDEKSSGIAGISNGMRRLTLASLDGVEEYTHGGEVMK